MSETKKISLDTDAFWERVNQHIDEGLTHRDAVDLAAAIMGGDYAVLVSQAVSKYQEATHSQTELSKQDRVDEYALASMDRLWHGESFEGSTEQMVCSVEEVFTDALYFILKYAHDDGDNALTEALKGNENVCGDKIARESMIRKVLKNKDKGEEG